MFYEPIEELYFNWLCAKVVRRNEVPTPSLTYLKLFRILHNTEYVWLVPNDDNRVADGLELRSFFLNETQFEADPLWAETGCSVLEMLIAFAGRAAFTTDMPVIRWFWIFLENLGLSELNDAAYTSDEEVSEILERFVWRTYLPNGQGGLFPIKYPQHDQRTIEVWYQFCEYLNGLTL